MFDASVKQAAKATPGPVTLIGIKPLYFWLLVGAVILLLILLLVSSIILIICLCRRRKRKQKKESKKDKKAKPTAVVSQKAKSPNFTDRDLDKTQTPSKMVENIRPTPLPTESNTKVAKQEDKPASIKKASVSSASQAESKKSSSRKAKSAYIVPGVVVAHDVKAAPESDVNTAMKEPTLAELTPPTPALTLVTPVAAPKKEHKKRAKKASLSKSKTAPGGSQKDEEEDEHSTDCSCSDENRSEKPKEHVHPGAKPEENKPAAAESKPAFEQEKPPVDDAKRADSFYMGLNS